MTVRPVHPSVPPPSQRDLVIASLLIREGLKKALPS